MGFSLLMNLDSVDVCLWLLVKPSSLLYFYELCLGNLIKNLVCLVFYGLQSMGILARKT